MHAHDKRGSGSEAVMSRSEEKSEMPLLLNGMEGL